MRQIIATGITG